MQRYADPSVVPSWSFVSTLLTQVSAFRGRETRVLAVSRAPFSTVNPSARIIIINVSTAIVAVALRQNLFGTFLSWSSPFEAEPSGVSSSLESATNRDNANLRYYYHA